MKWFATVIVVVVLVLGRDVVLILLLVIILGLVLFLGFFVVIFVAGPPYPEMLGSPPGIAACPLGSRLAQGGTWGSLAGCRGVVGSPGSSCASVSGFLGQVLTGSFGKPWRVLARS